MYSKIHYAEQPEVATSEVPQDLLDALGAEVIKPSLIIHPRFGEYDSEAYAYSAFCSEKVAISDFNAAFMPIDVMKASIAAIQTKAYKDGVEVWYNKTRDFMCVLGMVKKDYILSLYLIAEFGNGWLQITKENFFAKAKETFLANKNNPLRLKIAENEANAIRYFDLPKYE